MPAETQLIERARETEHAHQSLLAESADFRRIFRQAPGFIAVLQGPRHIFTFTNDAYIRLVGNRAVVGRSIGETLPEIEGQGILALLDKVFTTGVAQRGENVRLMIERTSGEAAHELFMDFSYEAIKDRNGEISGVFVQGMDRTDAVKTLKRQRVLLDEINHRVKNTLSTVQSIASQTLRAGKDLPTAANDLESRIIALSRAHNQLSAREWADTELSRLVASEMSSYANDRVAANGPTTILNPKASIAIAMLIHELSSNAAKHGAFSSKSGTLAIDWRIVQRPDGDHLEIDWRERGGPAASTPKHRGFGSRMINRVVAGELSGVYSARYENEGFSCNMIVPTHSFAKGRDALVD